MNKPERCTEPIFIQGISPRSGTNFFYKLLDLHPHCKGVIGNEMPEDYLLFNARLLIRYVDIVNNFWNQYWQYTHWRFEPRKREELKHELCKSLGDGLISYLKQKANGKALITKTPSVYNLKYFFKLFPRARLLILIRDGRAVAESSVRSFGWSYEFAMQRWAEAAHTIIEFDREFRNSDFKYLIVKYEDLVANPKEELSRVFEFLDLDIYVYNFDEAMKLPILGSSEFFKNGDVHHLEDYSGWKIVEKKTDFDPNLRFSHWSRGLHRRFNWIAGNVMRELGYETELSGVQENFCMVLRYQVSDMKWQAINRFKSMLEEWEKTLYTISVSPRYFRRLKIDE